MALLGAVWLEESVSVAVEVVDIALAVGSNTILLVVGTAVADEDPVGKETASVVLADSSADRLSSVSDLVAYR